MSKTDYLYAPCSVQKWKSISVSYYGKDIPVITQPGMGQYFLPVFETEEESIREYPGVEIVILKRR